jgi:hypothetical protein
MRGCPFLNRGVPPDGRFASVLVVDGGTTMT